MKNRNKSASLLDDLTGNEAPLDRLADKIAERLGMRQAAVSGSVLGAAVKAFEGIAADSAKTIQL